MFSLGDIVKPKEYCIGHNYEFVIKERFQDNRGYYYKLKQYGCEVKMEYGPADEQVAEIKQVELSNWRDDELIPLISYMSSDSLGNSFDTVIMDEPISINTVGTTISSVSPGTAKLSFDIPTYNYYKELCEKEKNNMKILDIYKERKEKKLREEYENQKEEILNQDTIQSIINEMQDQVNAILEEEDIGFDKLKVNRKDLITEETRKKIQNLDKECHKNEDELRSTLEEIRALFEMTEDYNERLKILKTYKIVDKNGKIII